MLLIVFFQQNIDKRREWARKKQEAQRKRERHLKRVNRGIGELDAIQGVMFVADLEPLCSFLLFDQLGKGLYIRFSFGRENGVVHL